MRANLTNGKIFYAAGSGFSSTYENGPYHWNTFDPATGSITNHTVNEDLFCMGQAVLPDGKVLCAGGDFGVPILEVQTERGKDLPLRLNIVLVRTRYQRFNP